MTKERELVAARVERMRAGLGRTVDTLGARADVRTRLFGARSKPHSGHTGARADEDKTIAELIKQATEQAAALARDEVRLAQLELGETASEARGAVALLAAAAIVALLGGGALTATLVALMAAAVGAVWLAALIVALVLFAVAFVAAVAGRRRLEVARAAHQARARQTRETTPG